MKKRQNLAHLLAIALVGIFLLAVVDEFYQLPAHPYWSEKYHPFWYAGLAGWAIFSLLALACIWLFLAYPERFQGTINRIIHFRQRLGVWRWVIVLPLALLPAVLSLIITPGWIFSGASLRLLLWLGVGLLLAVLLTRSDRVMVDLGSAAFSLLLLSNLHVIASYLAWVTPYPFSLTWSEVNRFYDYSVMLGSSRYLYNGRLTIPYFAPGRYLLWGILFAIPGTPIWLHRLWDAFLWLAPHLLLGWLLARWSGFSRLARWGLAAWIFLFLFQGPVYTPLVLSAILVVLAAPQTQSSALGFG